MKNKIVVTKEVKAHNGRFGKWFDFDHEGANVVVLCTNNGTGLKPIRVLLPHQIYLSDLERIISDREKENGNNDITEFVVIPANSKDYITIATIK